ncbi:PUA-like domain-containing protein [Mycena vitilis]|nr:PUA-like domain-containing protein [Mycena vitilis]
MVKPDSRIHGDISGVPIGLMFADRDDVFQSGLHGHPLAGIFGTKDQGGAFSIVLNEGYEDDEDTGESIIYTGEGKGKPPPGQPGKPGNVQQGPQNPKSTGNAALAQNVISGYPVRVIRGPEGNIRYCPMQGYRYDGLYNVVRAYVEEGKAGFKMCKFELQRCTDVVQEPLPLHITGVGHTDKYWSPNNDREALAVRKRREDSVPDTTTPAQTIQQRNQAITGKKRLPADLSFKKKAAV